MHDVERALRAAEWEDGHLTPLHRRIVREVLTAGPVPRSELARRLNMSRASLTRLTKPFLAGGLFVEHAVEQDRRTGRPVRPLDVDADQRHFVGVNVTADNLTAVLTTLRATKVATSQEPLPSRDPGAVVDAIARVAASFGVRGSSTMGIGVSVGGRVRGHATVSRAPFLNWDEDVDLAARVAAATDVPAIVDNDVQALTRAEHWFGAGRGHAHFAVVTIGAGIGCGLLVHDRLVQTDDTGLGLLGHYPIDSSGPLCPLGHRGCAASLLADQLICDRLSGALGRDIAYDEFLALAEAGDPAARATASESGVALGRLVSAVANVSMAPRVIVTGESVDLVRVARSEFDHGIHRDRHPAAAALDVVVKPCDRTEWARGAAVTAIQHYVLG